MRRTTGNCRKCGGFFTGGWLDDGCCAVCYRRGEANFMADFKNARDLSKKLKNGIFNRYVEHEIHLRPENTHSAI